MTSLRARGQGFARGGVLLTAVLWTGCGITLPGDLVLGNDKPGVMGAAGSGGFAGRIGGGGGGGIGEAGTGQAGFGLAGRASPAGRGGGVAGVGPIAGSAGRRGGTGGVAGGPIRGGAGGWGAAGWGWGGTGAAGTGAPRIDRDGDGADASIDCNDLDPAYSPYISDFCCDGVDSDCSGRDGPSGVACRCMTDPNTSDFDRDGFSVLDGDCNDGDPRFFPKSWHEECCDGHDFDCDGNDDPPGSECDCGTDADRDGYDSRVDCNDYDFNVHPGALEICQDGIDNDCDGIDQRYENCANFDADGDGYSRASDCDDYNWSINPGAPELCGNRQDDNCNGLIDESRSCVGDADGDGWNANEDCNDSDPTVWPGAYEDCFDGRDTNCDGLPDLHDWACRNNYDLDGDGYPWTADCNDSDPRTYPGAGEVCGDGQDNDCDGLIDQYPYCDMQMNDWDRDGFPWNVDCNDGNSSVYPGSPYEVCCDGFDSNCDGDDSPPGAVCTCQIVDNDGDGYGVGFTDPGKADCNDQDSNINPGMPENCNDGRDNNCNSRVDGADPQCFIGL